MNLALTQVRRRTAERKPDSLTEPAGIGLELVWKDGTRQFVTSKALRGGCPCATCQEARGDLSHQKPLHPPPAPVTPGRSLLRVIGATAQESENLLKVWPVGNYAIGIAWGDRHDSGIYTYELLRKLAEEFRPD